MECQVQAFPDRVGGHLMDPIACCACQLITVNPKRCEVCAVRVGMKFFCETCYGNHMRVFHSQQVLASQV